MFAQPVTFFSSGWCLVLERYSLLFGKKNDRPVTNNNMNERAAVSPIELVISYIHMVRPSIYKPDKFTLKFLEFSMTGTRNNIKLFNLTMKGKKEQHLEYCKHATNIRQITNTRKHILIWHRFLNCFYSRKKYLLIRAFIAYVRPLLEYCCSIWSP